MARISRSAKQHISDLMACKVAGICERDKLVNDYLKIRIANFDKRIATFNQAWRHKNDLPPCLPVCPEPPCEPDPVCKTDPCCVEGEFVDVEVKAEVVDEVL